MVERAGRGPGAAALAGVLALLAFAGCAPRRVPLAAIAPAQRAERFRAALDPRAARAAAVDAEILLWPEAPAGTRLPGVEGRLALAAPDAFRLRVGALFGTAIDLGARGDSLAAYVPSQRRGVRLDAVRDTLGLARPGGLAFRALSATWRPPDAAWLASAWQDSLIVLAWPEGEDTLGLALGSHGLPAWAEVRGPGRSLRIDYQGWEAVDGVPWPARFTIVDGDGDFRLACKVSRVRFARAADPARLAVTIPPGAVQLTVPELRRVLERLGTL